LIWKKSDFDYLLKEMPAFKELMKTLGAKNKLQIKTGSIQPSVTLPKKNTASL
jgi:hypothetical protein